MISDSLSEDLLANAILGIVLIGVSCLKDFCKRVSHSDCAVDATNGLSIKLPTWHSSRSNSSEDNDGGDIV